MPETRSRRGWGPSGSLAKAPEPRAAPPAPPQRRRGDDAGHHLAVLLEREQRRPRRDPAHVALGAVDGIDDPPARAGRDGPVAAELLAEHLVLRPQIGQALAQRLLDRAVGLADGRDRESTR